MTFPLPPSICPTIHECNEIASQTPLDSVQGDAGYTFDFAVADFEILLRGLDWAAIYPHLVCLLELAVYWLRYWLRYNLTAPPFSLSIYISISFSTPRSSPPTSLSRMMSSALSHTSSAP